MDVRPDSAIERARRAISQVAIAAAIVLLVVGVLLFESGSAGASYAVFRVALVLLVAIPVVSVTTVLIEEIRGRDWPFVLAAVVVLGLIAYSVIVAIT